MQGIRTVSASDSSGDRTHRGQGDKGGQGEQGRWE